LELLSADPHQLPRIVHNYLQAPEDQRALTAAVKYTDQIIQASAWDEIRGAAVSPPLRTMPDEEVLAWLRANVSTQYHPCSTCRMGSDDLAVVDDTGRVHGVEQLRVADASVLPSITSGNLQGPTLMLAEKISDHIKGVVMPPDPQDYADKRHH
jgi:choline dehydrogenase